MYRIRQSEIFNKQKIKIIIKKKYYILVLVALCFIVNAKAQIINFQDANFKVRLLSADYGNGIAYHGGLSFKIDANNDNEIQVSEALLVNHLVLSNGGISDLSGLEYFVNLEHFNCGNNSIATLNLTPFPNLIGFDAYNNNLTSLNVSNLEHLTNFSCNNNQLVSLTVTNLSSLHSIHCGQNQLSELDVSGLSNLIQLNCQNNQLTNLNVTNHLTILNCSSNNLISLYIKNDSNESTNLDFSNNPTLQYVCADDFQLTQVQNKISQYGYSNCFVNSYCSFVPGGNFYSIHGSITYDEANDGCDVMDIAYPALKLVLSDGTHTGNTFGSDSGIYNYNVQAGQHTIQPVLANPAYFTVSPTSASINFPMQASPYTQNFCVTPNGLHPDLELRILQTDVDYSALPGSDNTYKIIYTNKGTNTQSGTVNLTFNDAILDYSSSTQGLLSQSTNSLLWSFSDLKPFESNEIQVTFYLNSATDSPPVNEGDSIVFASSIHTPAVDETPTDNTFTLNQLASNTILLGKPDNSLDGYFILYPNPTSNILTIETKKYIKKESIKVYNVRGQLVVNLSKAEHLSSMDVTDLKAGNYFISIQTSEGIVKSKFIKK